MLPGHYSCSQPVWSPVWRMAFRAHSRFFVCPHWWSVLMLEDPEMVRSYLVPRLMNKVPGQLVNTLLRAGGALKQRDGLPAQAWVTESLSSSASVAK